MFDQQESKSAESLIGVIDLRKGRAVHAIEGRRSEYRDVELPDASPGDPVALATRYRRLGIRSLYVADLDAIAGDGNDASTLAELSRLTDDLMVDAGASAPFMAASCAFDEHVRFVLPTESFAHIDQWAVACEQLDEGQAVLGLDLADNRVRIRSGTGRPREDRCELLSEAAPWIDRAMMLGVRAAVVLDLSFVGALRGPGTATACAILSRQWPEIELISGGGVRTTSDLKKLLNAGCQRVLAATALHHDYSATHLLVDRHESPQAICPVCRGNTLIEIRGKLQCERCHTICETCCEGGRC